MCPIRKYPCSAKTSSKPAGGRKSDIRQRGPAKTSVYHSADPAMFGINQDERYFLCTLPVAAPEIILHDGQYYIAALNEGSLNGIRIAKLKWARP